jgi:hypothetical protein
MVWMGDIDQFARPLAVAFAEEAGGAEIGDHGVEKLTG